MDSSARVLGKSQLEKRRRKRETTLGTADAIAACLSEERYLPPRPQRVKLVFPTEMESVETDLRSIIYAIFQSSELGAAALKPFGDDVESAR